MKPMRRGTTHSQVCGRGHRAQRPQRRGPGSGGEACSPPAEAPSGSSRIIVPEMAAPEISLILPPHHWSTPELGTRWALATQASAESAHRHGDESRIHTLQSSLRYIPALK
ncbi:hypothetical protein AAFF_G00168740 [Aldrovandia affinis]|uniref:Uncharacterized protein n=1 Tax=Aldrovandia affinis TaxID=143900 RepID=A0AAD7W7T2_9TELE|nr:hypothetical protein AAFF_G00168740 [Aldrovandia affinis]